MLQNNYSELQKLSFRTLFRPNNDGDKASIGLDVSAESWAVLCIIDHFKGGIIVQVVFLLTNPYPDGVMIQDWAIPPLFRAVSFKPQQPPLPLVPRCLTTLSSLVSPPRPDQVLIIRWAPRVLTSTAECRPPPQPLHLPPLFSFLLLVSVRDLLLVHVTGFASRTL